jgi:glycerol uptake facilitator-like aquaporin
MAAMATLIKVACLLVAALLFIIGAFSDDSFAELIGIGLALVAIGLVVEELPGVKVSTARRTGP